MIGKSKITAIVAMDQNRLIGDGHQIPWYVPEDFLHFKQTTLNHNLVMGRKTFETIGQPLPKRKNFVITRNPEWKHDGVYTIGDIGGLPDDGNVFVIGGAEIYKLFDPFVDEWIISLIKGDYSGDTYLHEFEQDFGMPYYLRKGDDFDIYSLRRKTPL